MQSTFTYSSLNSSFGFLEFCFPATFSARSPRRSCIITAWRKRKETRKWMFSQWWIMYRNIIVQFKFLEHQWHRVIVKGLNRQLATKKAAFKLILLEKYLVQSMHVQCYCATHARRGPKLKSYRTDIHGNKMTSELGIKVTFLRHINSTTILLRGKKFWTDLTQSKWKRSVKLKFAGITKYSEKMCSSATLYTTILTRPDLR
jgi:hypothetical protein